MGWFWADSPAPAAAASGMRNVPHALPKDSNATPPPSCPMHKPGADALKPVAKPPASSPESACPYTPDNVSQESKATSKYSKYNPLNYMFPDLSQERAKDQTIVLPTEREPSTIPKGTGDGNWEYPSPQQMYNALLRKGYTDTDATAVESMVSVHNFLNEGAWAEIVEWERRFGKGLFKGWENCRRGEEGSKAGAEIGANEDEVPQPKLVRFMGRPKEMTPKAAMIQAMGWAFPEKYGTEPPFDRHDWFVQREYNGQKKEVRYIIDYYSGGEEPTGEPIFYLDVRPALTPTQAVERMMRWSGDVWYRASGASDRAAEENTNTLVLTSADKHYVDIRILDPSHPPPNSTTDPQAILRLEWGFAGTAISTPAVFKDGDKSILIKPAHTQWVHEIDNKIRNPGPNDRDEGYMYPVEGTNEVLEKGAMVNPDTGKVEDYEELWEDLEVGMTEGEKNDYFMSWVLKTTDAGEVNGMVIRIGEWVQGVMRKGDDFSVVGWKWTIEEGWKRVLAIGEDFGLDSRVFEKDISVGDSIKVDSGVEWEFKSCHKHRNSPANSIGDMMAVQSPVVTPAKMSPSSSMGVTVIPSIIDPTCGTSPVQYRHSTMEVLWNSMQILSRNLYCIPQMMGSFTFSVAQMIPKSSGRDMYEMGIQCMLCIMECWAMLMVIPAFLTMPGAMFMMCCVAIWGAMVGMSWLLRGRERICESIMPVGDFGDEKWIFVNGSCTSYTQMMHHLTRLSIIFHRRMTGIHNRTLGLPLDLLLHFLSITMPIHRTLYSQLRETLLTPSIQKVVILSHSTGSKIVSDILDQLHADLPASLIAKLEIYTFGAAGGSFSNPLVNPLCMELGALAENENTNMKVSYERVIPHIEHYIPLTSSPLSTMSILHPVLNTLDSRFCGRMFILNGFHPVLFEQYLDMMFTWRKSVNSVDGSETRGFWDEMVRVDGETAEKREFTAGARGAAGMGKGERRWSGMMQMEKEGKRRPGSWSWSKMGMDGVGMVRREAKALERKRMREVGRLGGYEGGERLSVGWFEGKGMMGLEKRMASGGQ
ncbi:hypothetical protein BOTCAL_0058g00120 [Botryotinia calthae]|uniref:Protein HRI1 n=1 Tax=Botryotinia calthae TaxID=38488 RepID=A0A4Y8DCL4_9HELO|nr:hypothetical protein BOTCAL_0058g00120 [Botryotinia calthae]